MHVDIGLQKSKASQEFFGWACKWMYPVWSRNSKIDCISKMNRRNKLNCSCWYEFKKAKSWLNYFRWAWSKMAMAF